MKASPTPILAEAAGASLPPGGSLILWSHVSSPYAIGAVNWDPTSETGLVTLPGTQIIGTDANTPGSTVAEVRPDGEVGVVINSNDLNLNGTVPHGPMPFIPSWTPATTMAPFADASVGALVAEVSLQVPYSEQPGKGATVSSNQIVLYFGLKDRTTGRSLAYGLTLFDSRGTSAPYLSVDGGNSGTGAVVVTTPAGMPSGLAVSVPGTAGFQGGPWTGMRNFAFEITPQSLRAAVASANRMLPHGSVPFSSNVADYTLAHVSIDSEIEYFGQQNSFAYSVGSFTVSTLTTAFVASQQAAIASADPQVNIVSNGNLPETISVAPGVNYVVKAGSGPLSFHAGQSTSTVWGGAGTETVTGDKGRVFATGGAGPTFLVGGALGGNVLAAGAGDATLIGSNATKPDVLYGGPAGSAATLVGGNLGSVMVAGAGDALIYALAGASTMFGASGNGSAIIVGGSRGSMVVLRDGTSQVLAGAGSDTILTGAGSACIATGSGSPVIVQSANSSAQEAILLGSGSSTVVGGHAPTTYFLSDSHPSSAVNDVLVGFNPATDHFVLPAGTATDALASQRDVGWGTSVQLGEVTVTFVGLHSLNAAMFA